MHIEKEFKSKEYKDLWKAILSLKNVSECEKFFRDLCTMIELKSMAERWKVVKMVDKGMTYRDINEKTGVSTATITRVAHWLNHGMDGYRTVIDRLKGEK